MGETDTHETLFQFHTVSVNIILWLFRLLKLKLRDNDN